ncbi:MAG: hypothetical protein AAF432_03555 [Planctomycetota bacterium]
MSRYRGGLLFETLVALAIFIAASGFALRASRQAQDQVERRVRTQLALDFGLAKLAELDAGLTSLNDLRSDEVDAIGSMEFEDDPTVEPVPFNIDIQTQRSPYGNLSVVQLTVTEREPDGGWGAEQRPVSVTVRELIALRDGEADEYEVDELLEDLPEPSLTDEEDEPQPPDDDPILEPDLDDEDGDEDGNEDDEASP